jgi:hypothetical protein
MNITNRFKPLKMLSEKPNNQYFITYSNSFYFEGVLLAFRKKLLFDISGLPKLIPFNENANCWIVNRKQLTLSKAKEIVKTEPKTVDVSELQWNLQINLDLVFNL